MTEKRLATAPDRPPLEIEMRHNQRLDYQQLRVEAEHAADASGKKRIAIAEELGVSSGAISRALQETGPTFARLQIQIIEHLTDYEVEQEPIIFRVRKKGARS